MRVDAVSSQPAGGFDRFVHPALVGLSIVGSTSLMLALAGYVLLLSPLDELAKPLYLLLFFALYYCCLAYQLNRLGAALRLGREVHEDDSALDYLLDADAPGVTVLVPTYREERRVLLMTVLSAALTRYSNRRVVVLVDDAPGDSSLPATLATIEEARDLLAEPMDRFGAESAAWRARSAAGPIDTATEARHVRALYAAASQWLDDLGTMLEGEISPEFVHVDRFVIDNIIRDLAGFYRAHATDLGSRSLDAETLDHEYRRLSTLFCADITGFERKRYQSLSHAPNKATNLNSYIGLMGGRYVVSRRGGKAWLEDAGEGEADLVVPATPYVLTLDADSVVLKDYILRLMHIIHNDAAVGVVQTPYRAFPGSQSAVERIAGATTDIQYLVHQGSSHFSAAHWVGANALLRFDALTAIAREQVEDGKTVKVFIQDLTVIEDTGSTIDLLDAGWVVHNHFRPLAYSATPADFGSLAVQRQRWSNGGLIIFPMLLRQVWASGPTRRGLEFLLRAHYLLSPLIGNTAVFLLMVMVAADARNLVWTPLAMAPYFLLYGMDLRRVGYRFRDLFAICALNLMLLPVGFAGVMASIMQMVTGQKGTFWRTPKVAGRTAVHWFYILFNIGMLALMAMYLVEGLREGAWLESLVPAFNVSLYVYGLFRFIGLRDGAHDLLMAALRVPLVIWSEFVSALRGSLDWRGSAGRRARLTGAALAGISAAFFPMSFGSAISLNEPVRPEPARSVTSALQLNSDAMIMWHPSLPADQQAIYGRWMDIGGGRLYFRGSGQALMADGLSKPGAWPAERAAPGEAAPGRPGGSLVGTFYSLTQHGDLP